MRIASDATLVQQASKVVEVLKQQASKVPPEFRDKVVARELSDFTEKAAEVARINAQSRSAVDEKRKARNALRQTLKRVRGAVKMVYGDDSPEFAMVGGVRLSERKPRSKKAEVEKKAA